MAVTHDRHSPTTRNRTHASSVRDAYCLRLRLHHTLTFVDRVHDDVSVQCCVQAGGIMNSLASLLPQSTVNDRCVPSARHARKTKFALKSTGSVRLATGTRDTHAHGEVRATPSTLICVIMLVANTSVRRSAKSHEACHCRHYVCRAQVSSLLTRMASDDFLWCLHHHGSRRLTFGTSLASQWKPGTSGASVSCL